MKLTTNKFFKCINIINLLYSLSKFFQNVYKRFVRLYSNGDGKLYIVANNCEDMKIIQVMDIDKNIVIDKIYIITELFAIVNNILNYVDFEININHNIILFEDGKFFLNNITLPKDKIDEYFNLSGHIVNDKFGVDSDIEDEIKSISRIMKMKSMGINSYFYRNSNLFFNFKDIYVKKESILSFIVTDIFSLKMIGLVLLKNKGSIVSYGKVNNNLILKSDKFYIESKIHNEDENLMNQMEKFFNEIEYIEKLDLKLEFYNFISTINYFDSEALIIFSAEEDKILIQSQYHTNKSIGEFNFSDLSETFSVNTDSLYKMLEYYINNVKSESIEISIVNSNGSKFLLMEIENTKIITEIY